MTAYVCERSGGARKGGPMVAEMRTPDSWRRAGCDERCDLKRVIVPGLMTREPLIVHDPDAHEEYGICIAGVDVSPDAVIETGLIALDLRRCELRVDGVLVHLTANEWGILGHLARRLDRVCPQPEILRAVWGDASFDDGHLLRVNMSRVRSKLGPAGAAIETKQSIGYRLLALPVGEVSGAVQKYGRIRLPPGRWAWQWDACRTCGTTDHQHQGHGFCTGCYDKGRRQIGRQP